GQSFTDARTVRGFYHRDARRDAASGNLIDSTTASDSYTNSWISEGEDLLWAKTLEIYHARFARDGEALAYYASQYRQALAGIQRERLWKSTHGFEVEPYI